MKRDWLGESGHICQDIKKWIIQAVRYCRLTNGENNPSHSGEQSDPIRNTDWRIKDCPKIPEVT
jgi:hypothetical protein